MRILKKSVLELLERRGYQILHIFGEGEYAVATTDKVHWVKVVDDQYLQRHTIEGKAYGRFHSRTIKAPPGDKVHVFVIHPMGYGCRYGLVDAERCYLARPDDLIAIEHLQNISGYIRGIDPINEFSLVTGHEQGRFSYILNRPRSRAYQQVS